jgi:hypothetical protein
LLAVIMKTDVLWPDVKAHEIDFGDGARHGNKVQFPLLGTHALVLDFQRRLVCGPRGQEGPTVEIPFGNLTTVAIDEHEVQGDTKVVTSYFLHFSDGQDDLIFRQRLVRPREYYRGMAADYAAQDLAIEILHAIPTAVGFTHPRLARPDLVGPRMLRELL